MKDEKRSFGSSNHSSFILHHSSFQRAALETLFAMLRVDSIWGRERALAVQLAAEMSADGFADVALVEPLPGRPSVVGRIPGTGGGRSLILNGHIDIYELSADWTRDPFAPVIEDGRIYGAGVADEKAGTAALLSAARLFLDPARRPKGDVIFMAVSAHFEGGLGTRAVLEHGVTADGALTCEPSEMRLANAHRGAAYLVITTRGRQAHTSAKGQGLNAIETMIPIMQGLSALQIPHEPDAFGGPVLNIGTIRGGTKHNQVPDRCEISVDIRVPPSVSPEAAKTAVEQMIAGLRRTRPEIDATVEFSPYWLSGPRYPTLTPADAPIVAAVRRACVAVGLPDEEPIGLPVWADMCVLDRAGIPAVNIGPGGPPYNWADEYVTVDEYVAAVRVYAATIEEFCNQPQ
jgi:acetylornithine deacetylase/succinyl-diaminopimelate desuccinylase-like protein